MASTELLIGYELGVLAVSMSEIYGGEIPGSAVSNLVGYLRQSGKYQKQYKELLSMTSNGQSVGEYWLSPWLQQFISDLAIKS